MADREADSSLSVHYTGLSQEEFDKKFGRVNRKRVQFWKQVFKKRNVNCSSHCIGKVFEHILPIFNVIRTYKPKDYILGDIIAGLSVGVMTIPQSMGYAIMGAVPPIMGIYTSFFPVLLYCIFTRTRHVTVGTMALASLVHASTIQRATVGLQEQIQLNPNDTTLVEELENEKMMIAVTVTFMSGLVLIIFSILRLSFVVTYIGEALIGGFLTGSNIRVLTQQLKLILGVRPLPRPGLLEFVYLLYDIALLVPQTNIASVFISIVTIGILVFVKYFINVRFKDKLKVPIPVDLTVVIIATILSHFCLFEERFGVRIVAFIPKGVPKPSVPSKDYMSPYILDAFVLAILNYLMIYIMAVIFSKRHNILVHPNQEMFAVGISNVFSGFFSGIGASISPPRSFIMETTGGKTQLSYLISALLILIAMLFVGPLLESLPVCVLASIIVVACIPLFDQYYKGVIYWRCCYYDFSIWLVAALSNLLTTIEIGLLIGIGFSFIVVVFRTQRSFAASLAETSEGFLVDESKYADILKENHALCIFRFEGPLYFATMDHFKTKLFGLAEPPYALTSVDTVNDKATKVMDTCEINPDGQISYDTVDEIALKTNQDTHLTIRESKWSDVSSDDKTRLSVIIIDCTAITFMDTPASTMLSALIGEYSDKKVHVLLAGCTQYVQDLLQKIPSWKAIINEALYPSVHDAVLASKRLQMQDSI